LLQKYGPPFLSRIIRPHYKFSQQSEASQTPHHYYTNKPPSKHKELKNKNLTTSFFLFFIKIQQYDIKHVLGKATGKCFFIAKN
jgi:hypothetical protein